MRVDEHGRERPDGLPYTIFGWILMLVGAVILALAFSAGLGEYGDGWAMLYFACALIALGMPFIWVGSIIHAISFVASALPHEVVAPTVEVTEDHITA